MPQNPASYEQVFKGLCVSWLRAHTLAGVERPQQKKKKRQKKRQKKTKLLETKNGILERIYNVWEVRTSESPQPAGRLFQMSADSSDGVQEMIKYRVVLWAKYGSFL